MDLAAECRAYRLAHPRATRARCDAYGLTLQSLIGSGTVPSVTQVNTWLTGGKCSTTALRTGIADAVARWSRR